MTEIPSTSKLYFGPWYRRSPYFESTLRAGCKAYDIYNKMYLPAEYDDPNIEYQALQDGVTLWDVGVERTVQVSGPDADRLIDMVTCRDLTKCAIGQGKYMLVTAPDGGIVNDPVLLHVEKDKWWMQLADSDAGLYTLGVLANSDLDAEVSYPDVHPVQVQGPKSGLTLEKIAGKGIYDLKYYWCGHFQIGDIPVVISRTGWSAVPGFEVNLLDYSRGAELWDAIMAAGEEYRDPPDLAQRGPPGRGRDLQLGIRHHAQGHAVPRHRPGAAGRGAASGLHRQGGPGTHPRLRRRPQAGRDRVRFDRAADGNPRQLAGVLQRP